MWLETFGTIRITQSQRKKMKIRLNQLIIENINCIKSGVTDIVEGFIYCLKGFHKKKVALANMGQIMRFDFSTGPSDSSTDEYLTVAQLAQRYPAFSQGSIRWLIFNSEINGFNKVIRKIGRKVILNLREFKKYLEEQTK